MNINFQKWRKIGVFGLCAAVIAASHQNCGPMPAQDMIESDDASLVDTIDDVKATTALSFSSKSVEVHSTTDHIALDGICSLEQDGAIFGWQIASQTSAGAASLQSGETQGFVRCEGGKFQVDLTPAQSLLECGESYKVTARLGHGQPGEVIVTRRCPAEVTSKASSVIQDLLSVQAPSSCVFELRDSMSTGCSVVCYSADGVVEKEQEVDAKSCSI